jgi:hypothetical protein
VIAGVVGFVVYAFYVSGPRWSLLRDAERVAVVAVVWIVLTVLLAWPAQELFADHCSTNLPEADLARCEDRAGNVGTKWGSAVAALLAIAIGVRWWRRPGPVRNS